MRIESNQTSYSEPFKSSIPPRFQDQFIDMKYVYDHSDNIADKTLRIFDFTHTTQELLDQGGSITQQDQEKLIDGFQHLDYNHFVDLIYSYNH